MPKFTANSRKVALLNLTLLSLQSIMGASFNEFRNHIWGPFLGDMVNISLREQSFTNSCNSHLLSLKLVLPLSFACTLGV